MPGPKRHVLLDQAEGEDSSRADKGNDGPMEAFRSDEGVSDYKDAACRDCMNGVLYQDWLQF
jgi:hypothetical protein